MRKQLLIACLLLLSICSYAQQITVKGIVTSATDKEPLIGATIQVKGSGTGTITGIDGDYTLMNVPANAILVYSTIGYQTQEIKVNGQTTINVVLSESAELLDEVVVIGYGAVKKSDLTSSIATVKGDEITETVTGNAMDALQGKINGVQVTSGGGPGTQPKVLIRGVTTVNGTDPLYVVDGMPVGTNINFLNSNDIESMEVLKDASAAAITASALLELSGYGDEKRGQKYFRYAEQILKQLSSETYLAREGENHGFILMHSVGSFPHNSEVDTPLNYADYYYLEALKRYKEVKSNGYMR